MYKTSSNTNLSILHCLKPLKPPKPPKPKKARQLLKNINFLVQTVKGNKLILLISKIHNIFFCTNIIINLELVDINKTRSVCLNNYRGVQSKKHNTDVLIRRYQAISLKNWRSYYSLYRGINYTQWLNVPIGYDIIPEFYEWELSNNRNAWMSVDMYEWHELIVYKWLKLKPSSAYHFSNLYYKWRRINLELRLCIMLSNLNNNYWLLKTKNEKLHKYSSTLQSQNILSLINNKILSILSSRISRQIDRTDIYMLDDLFFKNTKKFTDVYILNLLWKESRYRFFLCKNSRRKLWNSFSELKSSISPWNRYLFFKEMYRSYNRKGNLNIKSLLYDSDFKTEISYFFNSKTFILPHLNNRTFPSTVSYKHGSLLPFTLKKRTVFKRLLMFLNISTDSKTVRTDIINLKQLLFFKFLLSGLDPLRLGKLQSLFIDKTKSPIFFLENRIVSANQYGLVYRNSGFKITCFDKHPNLYYYFNLIIKDISFNFFGRMLKHELYANGSRCNILMFLKLQTYATEKRFHTWFRYMTISQRFFIRNFFSFSMSSPLIQCIISRPNMNLMDTEYRLYCEQMISKIIKIYDRKDRWVKKLLKLKNLADEQGQVKKNQLTVYSGVEQKKVKMNSLTVYSGQNKYKKHIRDNNKYSKNKYKNSAMYRFLHLPLRKAVRRVERSAYTDRPLKHDALGNILYHMNLDKEAETAKLQGKTPKPKELPKELPQMSSEERWSRLRNLIRIENNLKPDYSYQNKSAVVNSTKSSVPVITRTNSLVPSVNSTNTSVSSTNPLVNVPSTDSEIRHHRAHSAGRFKLNPLRRYKMYSSYNRDMDLLSHSYNLLDRFETYSSLRLRHIRIVMQPFYRFFVKAKRKHIRSIVNLIKKYKRIEKISAAKARLKHVVIITPFDLYMYNKKVYGTSRKVYRREKRARIRKMYWYYLLENKTKKKCYRSLMKQKKHVERSLQKKLNRIYKKKIIESESVKNTGKSTLQNTGKNTVPNTEKKTVDNTVKKTAKKAVKNTVYTSLFSTTGMLSSYFFTFFVENNTLISKFRNHLIKNGQKHRANKWLHVLLNYIKESYKVCPIRLLRFLLVKHHRISTVTELSLKKKNIYIPKLISRKRQFFYMVKLFFEEAEILNNLLTKGKKSQYSYVSNDRLLTDSSLKHRYLFTVIRYINYLMGLEEYTFPITDKTKLLEDKMYNLKHFLSNKTKKQKQNTEYSNYKGHHFLSTRYKR